MLQVTEFEKTRAYKDILERGIDKGVEKVARRMLDANRPVTEVAEMTGLTVAQVRALKRKSAK